jgi:DNA-binding PadR family transcriptional regulator
MSVRRGLLAILDQDACYGYQLRAEYARRTGAALNVGQIYTTLERLERDGLVEKRGTDERGHTYWGITAAGRDQTRRWFAEAEDAGGRDERAFKVALAATLPGVDAAGLVAAERRAAQERLDAIEQDDVAGDVAAAILREAERSRVTAEIAWLDAVAPLVAAEGAERTFALSSDRPRRGRPARGGVQTG